MEQKTIFNYNISRFELKILDINLKKEEYLKASTQLKKLHDMHLLMKIRGDEEKAKKILDYMISLV